MLPSTTIPPLPRLAGSQAMGTVRAGSTQGSSQVAEPPGAGQCSQTPCTLGDSGREGLLRGQRPSTGSAEKVLLVVSDSGAVPRRPLSAAKLIPLLPPTPTRSLSLGRSRIEPQTFLIVTSCKH